MYITCIEIVHTHRGFREFRDSREGDWLERFRDLADKNAVGHAREGMDFMIFPTASVPVMPAFLIGRIQWDNWVSFPTISLNRTRA